MSAHFHRQCLVLFLTLCGLTVLIASAAELHPSGDTFVEAAQFAKKMVNLADAPSGVLYDIGNPTLTDLWVDPVNGVDTNDGLTLTAPLKTLTAAWDKLPMTMTTTGYRINLLPGAFPCEPGPEDVNCINYFADRTGTFQYPILLHAANGPGTVVIRGGLNLDQVSYLYLVDLNLVGGAPLPTNSSGNNLLHLSNSQHVLLRGLTVTGPACANDTCNNLQEVLKVNQTQYLYVEDSAFSGAWHSVVDYMVVQSGHFVNNRLRVAGQWCMYVKGGSSYLRVEGNELSGCQLGFAAGQSANLAVMRSPWLHYEAYDIKFVNNVLHDIPGVGMSVSGGYNILFAYNTLYRVGVARDIGYPLAQFVHGERNCTPTDDLPDPVPNCLAFANLGGWGPIVLTDSLPGIPNRNVYVFNNLFYNPAPSQTLYSHLQVAGPITPSAVWRNVPIPSTADQNLVIAGNFIWNGSPDLPLGIEDPEAGCQPGNPTCNATQLVMSNTINLVEPQLANPAGDDFHPVTNSSVMTAPTFAIPDFVWSDAPTSPTLPMGTLTNTVTTDRDGHLRASSGPPGAYVVGSSLYSRIYLPVVIKAL